MNTAVVGMRAGEREHIVAHVRTHDPVLLVPEPDNPHDSHAVAVHTAPRAALRHPQDLASAFTDPRGVGHLHDEDRALLMDRKAGYVPSELAARLVPLPPDGMVGYVSNVRWRPADEWIDPQGHSRYVDGPEPTAAAGFDVAFPAQLARLAG